MLTLPKLLVLDNTRPSDYIAVLDGHDNNYFTGLALLQKGFGKRMLVCLDLPDVPLEGEELRQDRAFIQQTAGKFADNIDLCSNQEEDIFVEMNALFTKLDAHKILIVTPEAQSRAQYVASRRVLPQYTWSVHPAPDPGFNPQWWRSRLWTKNFVGSAVNLGESFAIKSSENQTVQRSAR
jgi:hypothetical protein